jgi:hypothetical protein
MNRSKKPTATNCLLGLVVLCAGTLAHAAPAIGTVTQLSGPLLAKKADGTIRVLGKQSAVENGDTLSTQKKGYAQIKFADDSQLILQPDTVLAVDQFAYEPATPQLDHADFTLIQGGLRMNAGQIGKRSEDRVVLNTPHAKIDMRNATAVVRYVAPDAEALAASRAYLLASTAALDAAWMSTRSDAPEPAVIRPLILAQARPMPPSIPSASPRGLSPGLYVHVIDGLINLTNKGGAQSFSAGQFGFTPSTVRPPVIVPNNPGLQFTPPPAFNLSSGTTPSSGPVKPNTVDCEVR